MDARTVTNVLLAIIILILVYKWIYPVWKAHKAQKAHEKRERLRIEVEPWYQEYLQKRRAIREKHDPQHKWSEFQLSSPDVPQAYRDELDALSNAYKGILAVRFDDSIFYPKSK